jgi:hypothetical protein
LEFYLQKVYSPGYPGLKGLQGLLSFNPAVVLGMTLFDSMFSSEVMEAG